MVHLSHIINDASCKILPSGPFLRTEHTDCCCKDTVSGSLKVECAVFLSFDRAARIPEEATASAFSSDRLTLANTKFATNVFLIPPGASRKNILPLLLTPP